jgi:hypothetical protein
MQAALKEDFMFTIRRTAQDIHEGEASFHCGCTLGYSFDEIIEKIKKVQTIGGAWKEQVCLRDGLFLRFFEVKYRDDSEMILLSGLVAVKVTK